MIRRFRAPEVVEDVEKPRSFDDFDLRLGDVMRGERATLGKSLLDVQRELKIKATYIAAIENADPSAFETPGFIAGYVRSYARYLGLDPEWAYKAFCAEGGFETAHGMSSAASSKRAEPRTPDRGGRRDPFAESSALFTPPTPGLLSRLEPGAIGSSAVLLALICGLGYGGYSFLNEMQKVEFVPVDQAPGVVSELDPLMGAGADMPVGADAVAGIEPRDADGFDRIYRPQALDVPVMVARDAPIATLDPRAGGAIASDTALTRREVEISAVTAPLAGTVIGTDGREAPAAEQETVRVVADNVPEVVMFAVRDSWVRVRAADGTVIYENIMNKGDRFVLPKTEEAATLLTGESGAIYFALNGETYGPAGRSGQVTKNLSLAAESLRDKYDVADLEKDSDLATVVADASLLAPVED
ncbi:helix-turn-helix domain-containing protein [Oceaniglobus trochenteri]|uniref:helix-turn-helix domain-containing protein n=1 Tax=Oceaniglobus trochenteri TaxID=2763260 RepID=UPI001CFF5AAB|nr:helix-turn-helix domain-containing protein [Oceaniglobus trochenteri]